MPVFLRFYTSFTLLIKVVKWLWLWLLEELKKRQKKTAKQIVRCMGKPCDGHYWTVLNLFRTKTVKKTSKIFHIVAECVTITIFTDACIDKAAAMPAWKNDRIVYGQTKLFFLKIKL